MSQILGKIRINTKHKEKLKKFKKSQYFTGERMLILAISLIKKKIIPYIELDRYSSVFIQNIKYTSQLNKKFVQLNSLKAENCVNSMLEHEDFDKFVAILKVMSKVNEYQISDIQFAISLINLTDSLINLRGAEIERD